jgi:hypothetical protein
MQLDKKSNGMQQDERTRLIGDEPHRAVRTANHQKPSEYDAHPLRG